MLKIRIAEEILQRRVYPLHRVDLALAQSLLQILGSEIDIYHLIRLGQHRVGNALANLYTDEVLDRVVEALQMLNVQRRDDVNAGGEDVLNILVPLCVSAAGGIRV